MSEETVTIPKDYFEHLLACLANQKYMGQWNADAMSDPESARATDRKNQEAIDKAWKQGMDFLHLGVPL